MTLETQRDLIEVIRAVAIPASGIYVVYLTVKHVACAINRSARLEDRPPRPTESDELWREWLDRDERRRLATTATSVDYGADPEIIDNRGRDPQTSCGLPGETYPSVLARRVAHRVVVISGGSFAGSRVRVLMESREVEGLWFIEFLEGAVRGDVAVVAGDWLG